MSDVGVQETAKAYAAYAEYCALGPTRSLRKLANRGQTGGKPGARLTTLEEWSSKYNWQERVKQYDVERAEEKRLAREMAREEMDTRHAENAKEDQEIARKEIKHLVEKHRISMAVVQFLKNSIEAERNAVIGEDAGTSGGSTKVEVDASVDGVKVVVYYPQLEREEEAKDGGE